MSRTVADLLEDLRSQLDEFNVTNATTPQLLSALNRAQRHAANITARVYEDMFWSMTSTVTVGGINSIDIPASAYGRRIEMLTAVVGDQEYEIQRINNHKKAAYIRGSETQRPYYYTLTKNKFELYPTPAAGVTINIHFNKSLEKMVEPQGRITGVNQGGNYILVDTVGDAVATTTTGFSSYINFIDWNTGEVKGTAQVAAIDSSTGQIIFKTSGLSRGAVLGKSVSTALPDNLAVDDYISLVTGTCVSELPDAYADYLIQYAVVEIRRRFGEPTEVEYAALKEQEQELQKMWVGRPASSQIRKASNNWGVHNHANSRRIFT
jgi:hypothetical protein